MNDRKTCDLFLFLGKAVKCPECHSTYVIEMKDEQSSPSKVVSPQKPPESVAHLEKSQSHSSIGRLLTHF